MRFLLDEDLSPVVAEVARGLGLDALSIHEVGRRGLRDEEQLRFAAAQDRLFVTRNRDDFVRLTVAFFRTGEPHPGLLVVPRNLPNHPPERVAHALRRRLEQGGRPVPYSIDFLAS